MKILKAHILIRRNHPDSVSLVTDLPPASYNAENLALSFNVAKGEGEEYVSRHFPGVPHDVVTDEHIIRPKFGKTE